MYLFLGVIALQIVREMALIVTVNSTLFAEWNVWEVRVLRAVSEILLISWYLTILEIA